MRVHRRRWIRAFAVGVALSMALAPTVGFAQGANQISAPALTGEAFFTGPGGTTAFKEPPNGSLGANLRMTGDFTGRLNGTEIRFTTGLNPGHLHDFVALFPSSSLIRNEFSGGFVLYQGVLDGVIQDTSTAGGGTERVLGNINIFRFGSDQFVSLNLSFFFSGEGGICQVNLFGILQGNVP